MQILVARCYWDFQSFKTCVKLRSAEIFVTLFYSRPTDVMFTLYCLLLHASSDYMTPGVCKTRTGYLRMADTDGKMRMEKNADNKKSKKEKTRNADGKKNK